MWAMIGEVDTWLLYLLPAACRHRPAGPPRAQPCLSTQLVVLSPFLHHTAVGLVGRAASAPRVLAAAGAHTHSLRLSPRRLGNGPQPCFWILKQPRNNKNLHWRTLNLLVASTSGAAFSVLCRGVRPQDPQEFMQITSWA